MEKVDMSALMSNLLVFSAVLVVAVAMVMGDQLVLLASNVVEEVNSLVLQVSNSVQMWLS